MKKLLIIILFPVCVFAQKKIQVSEDYTTSLIFPSEIDVSILGNEQEYFIKPPSSNSTISKFMLSLSYIKIDNVEKNTNLVVFTKDDNSYSFSLIYTKKPTKLDPYYITINERSNKTVHSTKNRGVTTVKVKDSYYSQDVITSENKDEPTKTSTFISLF